MHATACDYRTSGAWNAIACAVLCARSLALDAQQTRDAMGIAEYHGPRSQMMRCIDFPTMVKDGSGWGAMTGVSAAFLAQSGFSGAPALTIESDAVASIWADLGEKWRILERYFKPYPVCRWAQPAVEAAMELARKHRFQAKDIASIEVWSFHEACRLATRIPATTGEARYSLPFSVASVLRHGTLGAVEVADAALADPLTQHLSTSMLLREHAPYNDVFPAERWAHVRVDLHSGVQYDSEPAKPRGNLENALTEGEILDKFFGLANPVIGSARAGEIVALVAQLGQSDGALARLMELVLAPATRA